MLSAGSRAPIFPLSIEPNRPFTDVFASFVLIRFRDEFPLMS
jgi:hypothetical protein